MKTKTLLSAALLFSVLALSIVTTPTSAAPIVGFRAGNIIDDAIFTNKSSMSPTQIQQFLESQVPVCDTFGQEPSEFGGGTRAQWAAARGYSPPFTCLKDFSEGGKTASQIIYDVAQQFSINPQVLIVLLQKEQSLITDEWPIPQSSQYRTATGYGCPDTAPCDAEYFGLTNQLTWSGRMFRAIMDASPTWYTPYVLGNNYIQYNPNASCGGSNVFIENRATQALYNYTPYQPSQAALDAGWGQVDCGAYGNRNFYLYFTSWFGPSNGFIYRTVEDGRMYILGNNNDYYYIPNADQLRNYGFGYKVRSFVNINTAALSSYANAGDLTSLVRFGSSQDVYLVDNGNRYYVNFNTYTALGSPAVRTLPGNYFDMLYPAQNLSSVIRIYGDTTLYSLQQGKRRHIGGPSVYNNDGFSSIPITSLGSYTVNSIEKGAPILSAGTVMLTSDTNVYSAVNSDRTTQQPIDTSLGRSIKLAPYIDKSNFINLLTPSGSAMSHLVRDSSNNLYLVDGTSKYSLSASQLASLGKTADSFVLADASFLSRLTTRVARSEMILVRINSGPAVYEVRSGELYRINSLTDFNALNHSFNNVIDVSQATVDSLLTNNNRSVIVAGTLFRIGSDSRVYLRSTGTNYHPIPTADIFNEYGFSFSSVQTVSSSSISVLTPSNPLDGVAQAQDGSYWLISRGTRHWISPELSSQYRTNVNSFIPLTNTRLNSMRVGANATRYIRIDNNDPVFYVENGIKRPVSSPAAFAGSGGTSWAQVISTSKTFAESLQTGPSL